MAQYSASEKEYLLSHDIEKLFEELMESLILEMPKDPKAFVVQSLSMHHILSFQDISQLLEAFKQLSMITSPDLASLKIIDLACSMLHCDRASLFLYDERHNLLQMVVGKDARGIVLKENSGFTWKAFKSGEVINIHDAYSHPDFDASVDISTGYKTENMLIVPIKNPEGVAIGVLLAINKHEGSFSIKDEHILLHLSSQAGILIQHSIYYQKVINNELKTKALLQFVRGISKDIPGQSLAVKLVAQAKSLLQAETCNIFMVDYTHDLLIPIASESEFDFRLPLKTGILGKAVETGEFINIDNKDPRFTNEFDEKFGFHTETMLIVPIKGENSVVGIVQLTNKHSDSMFGDLNIYSKFDENDIELVMIFNETMGKKLEKLFISLSVGEHYSEERAVNFQSNFGKSKVKSQELPAGAIKETDEEEESKN